MITIDKVVLNIGVGAAGENLEKARTIIERVSGQKAVVTRARKRIPTWGTRKKMKIGVKVTLRKEKADKMLKMAFEAVDNQINKKSIADNGAFSFGVKEYIDLPGIKYDPDIGVFGFDVCVNLKKWGYRVTNRKRKKTRIPRRHRITIDEAKEFIQDKYGVKVIE